MSHVTHMNESCYTYSYVAAPLEYAHILTLSHTLSLTYHTGPFVLGDHFSMAECMTAPFAQVTLFLETQLHSPFTCYILRHTDF